jgi:hypothetical protein
MRIVFTRGKWGESIATIHRHDGVVVELPSYSRTHRVPHDLAHAVAEREFGLVDGVFGSIASGAMFENMRVVSGKQHHDAATRSRKILRDNKKALTLAEVMAGAVHHAVERGEPPNARHDWGIVRQEPFPYTDEQVDTAVRKLSELAVEWARHHRVEFDWPDQLIRS